MVTRCWTVLILLASFCMTGAAMAQTPGSLSGLNLTVSAIDLSNGTAIASGGTTALTLANKFGLFLGPDDFGAAGDGTTNDLTALTSGGSVHRLGIGTYYAGESIGVLAAGRWYTGGGSGRLKFLESGTPRLGAGDISIITAAPTTNPGYSDSGQTTAFDGDISHMHIAAATRISGTATLGQPATGYQLNPLASMIYLNDVNSSGWNQSDNSNDGRTGVAQIYLRNAQNGQGDMKPIYVSSFVTGTKPSATSFLANSAGGALGGGVFAGADGVLLQGIGDIDLTDNGHDVAAIGFSVNAIRTNVTGALGATWMMIRPQSQGSKPIDAFYSAGGKSRIGLDFTGVNLLNLDGTTASNAAIATKAGMMWFGNATNTDPLRFANTTVTGTETFGYSATTGWTASVGGTPILEATGTGVTATALRISAPTVPGSSSDTCSTGQVAYDTSYAYFCVATNTWKRTSLSTW